MSKRSNKSTVSAAKLKLNQSQKRFKEGYQTSMAKSQRSSSNLKKKFYESN